MGMFDSLIVTCPMCGVHVEIQAKPCLVEGEMQTFAIETAPEQLLRNATYFTEHCGCGCVYEVVDSFGVMCLRVARDIPISELPKRFEWRESSR